MKQNMPCILDCHLFFVILWAAKLIRDVQAELKDRAEMPYALDIWTNEPKEKKIVLNQLFINNNYYNHLFSTSSMYSILHFVWFLFLINEWKHFWISFQWCVQKMFFSLFFFLCLINQTKYQTNPKRLIKVWFRFGKWTNIYERGLSEFPKGLQNRIWICSISVNCCAYIF